MNVPVICQSMFSVEQVEYVRRIRASGLTRDQVLTIWERLDRIDAEFNQQVFSTPAATSTGATSSPQISREFMQLLQQERNQQANALMMMQMQQILSSAVNNNNKPTNLAQKNNTINPPQQPQQGETQVENGEVKHQQSTGDSTPKTVTSNESNVTTKSEELSHGEIVPTRLVDENDPELVDFLRKNGEPSICEQIRQFIALNGIKQHQVAVLVGTSQSYISKYLKADYLEMSERSRRNIYRWYVTYRNVPAKAISDACAVIANPHLQHSLSTSLPVTVPLSINNPSNPVLPLYPVGNTENNGTVSPVIGNNAPGSPRSTSSSSAGNNNNNSGNNGNSVSHWNGVNHGHSSSHRRFRFTFRAQQLAVLERAFSEDTYPTVERREELARQLSVGLDSDQAVSLFTVTNWFANRRKEAKRAAVEEGLNVEELGMKRGRGRPSILHRMASAQLRETRQNGVQLQNSGVELASSLSETSAKRARKSGPGDDREDQVVSDADDDSLSSTGAADAPDDLSSSSTGGHNYRQNGADLAVFPTPELIAS